MSNCILIESVIVRIKREETLQNFIEHPDELWIVCFDYIFSCIFLIKDSILIIQKPSKLSIKSRQQGFYQNNTCNSSNASFKEFLVRLPCDSSRSPNDMPFDRAFSQPVSSASKSLNRVTG